MVFINIFGKQVSLPLNLKIKDLNRLLNVDNTKNIEPVLGDLVITDNLEPFEVTLDQYNIGTELYKIINDVKFNSTTTISPCQNNKLFFDRSKCEIKFNRTLRVPDDNKQYQLPPSLGVFELDNLGTDIFLPMYQREAMWMNFSAPTKVAVKIGLGSVNAISGEPWEDGVLKKEPQNYIVCPDQPWLDGVKIKDFQGQNLVRQFVAAPLSSESLLEAQINKEKIEGGLKFEVFQLYDKNYQAYSPKFKKLVDINKTPIELGLKLKDKVVFLKKLNRNVSNLITLENFGILDEDILNINITQSMGTVLVKLLTGQQCVCKIDKNTTTLDLKNQVNQFLKIPVVQQKLIYAGKLLQDSNSLFHCGIKNNSTIYLTHYLWGGGGPNNNANNNERMMGIAAGGLILQKIYNDFEDFNNWNQKNYQKCSIYIVNNQQYKSKMPATSITTSTYKSLGYPWFEIYDEHKDDIASGFSNVKSIKDFKNIDKDLENQCAVCMINFTNVVIDPCGHELCSECFEKVIIVHKLEHNKKIQCHICKNKVITEKVYVKGALTTIDEYNNCNK